MHLLRRAVFRPADAEYQPLSLPPPSFCVTAVCGACSSWSRQSQLYVHSAEPTAEPATESPTVLSAATGHASIIATAAPTIAAAAVVATAPTLAGAATAIAPTAFTTAATIVAAASTAAQRAIEQQHVGQQHLSCGLGCADRRGHHRSLCGIALHLLPLAEATADLAAVPTLARHTSGAFA